MSQTGSLDKKHTTGDCVPENGLSEGSIAMGRTSGEEHAEANGPATPKGLLRHSIKHCYCDPVPGDKPNAHLFRGPYKVVAKP
jgi:hypothetical protein